MKLTRRQFAIGCGALASYAVADMRFGLGKPAPFSTPLPIPTLIDATKRDNAVDLKVGSSRHAFIKGKQRGPMATQRPSMDRSFACVVATKYR